MNQHHKLITIISNGKSIEHLIPDMYIGVYIYIYFVNCIIITCICYLRNKSWKPECVGGY